MHLVKLGLVSKLFQDICLYPLKIQRYVPDEERYVSSETSATAKSESVGSCLLGCGVRVSGSAGTSITPETGTGTETPRDAGRLAGSFYTSNNSDAENARWFRCIALTDSNGRGEQDTTPGAGRDNVFGSSYSDFLLNPQQ